MLLLHVPPVVTDASVPVEPTQITVVPVITAGTGYVVATTVVTQPSQVVNDIKEVPPATPVTVPSVATVATAVLLLLHVPHDDDDDNVVVEPAHVLAVPDIDAGVFTVTTALIWQPDEIVYVIVAVPGATPVTMPEETPTVATDVLSLVHDTPPLVALLSAVVEPWQTVNVPPIAAGSGLTFMLFVRRQPVGNVYVIVTAPVAAPVTRPVLVTEAVDGLLLVHAPPAVVLLSDVLKPRHTLDAPVITAGNGLTVTVAETENVDIAYTIVAVPAVTPVTTPAVLMVATDVLLLLHVPPDAEMLSAVVEPSHTSSVPEISPSIGLSTVML